MHEQRTGLRTGDGLVQFGSVSAENWRGMQDVADVVRYSKGVAVVVVVRRGEDDVRLHLTPKEWSGQGLLGCRITPSSQWTRDK